MFAVSVLRKKYQLPTIAELPQIKIDLLELEQNAEAAHAVIQI